MFDKTDSTGPVTQAARAVLPQTPRNPLVAAYHSANTNDPWRMSASQNADTGPAADPFTKTTRAAQAAQNPLVVAMSTDRLNATASTAAPSNAKRDVAPGLQERTFTSGNPLLKSHPANSFAETGTTTDSVNPLTTINLQENNEGMARANAIRQPTAESDGPKVAMLGDSGRAESNALMDKWAREDQTREMVREIERNPKAANALAALMHTQQSSETALAGMQSQRDIAEASDATQRRGQDIVAETHANQLVGNPLTNALTQARISETKASTDQIKQHLANVQRLNTETDPERRQAMIENILAAQGKNVIDSERLTLPMRRSNAEIDRARDLIAGMSPDEIKRKTAKTTNTGRENPDFDPTLERAVTLANRRKVGDDAWFDERQSSQDNTPAQPSASKDAGGDLMARFKADTTMQGHTLGKQTDQGVEVFDGSGKLIGHYQ